MLRLLLALCVTGLYWPGIVHGLSIWNNNKQYELVTTGLKYAEAETQCKIRGGNLAKISKTNLKDNDFRIELKNLLERVKWAWIGMTDRDNEGDWRWFDGSPVLDVKWEGHNSFLQSFSKIVWDCGCLGFHYSEFIWDENVCFQLYNYICEYDIKTSAVTPVVQNTGTKTSTSLEKTTGKTTVPALVKTISNIQMSTLTTGKVPLSTENSVTHKPDPQNRTTVRSCILINLKMGSSTTTAQPDWTSPSQSIFVCSRICLSKVPVCQVIAFSRREGRCMGYNDKANLFIGNHEIQKGFTFWENYCL